MTTGNAPASALLRIFVAALVLLTVLNVLLPFYLPIPSVSSTVGDTQGRHSSGREWNIDLNQAALTVEDSVNFQLDTSQGAAQWRAIQPPGHGYITTKEGKFRVSMFHALDCLDRIRRNVLERRENRDKPTSGDAHYCLDYIRQTIQCRSDIELEQVRSEYGGKSVQPFVTHKNCKDWSKVYEKIGKLEGR